MKRTSLIILLFTIVLLCDTCKKAGNSPCQLTLISPANNSATTINPTLKWNSCDTGISTVYIYYSTSQGNVIDSAYAKDSLTTAALLLPYNTNIKWYIKSGNAVSATYSFTTPIPNPDQIVIGKYYVTVEYDSSTIVQGGPPYSTSAILGHTTITITLVSPGVITLVDDSVSHMNVTESYNTMVQPSSGYLYGALGDPYAPDVNNDSYMEFTGDNIYAQYGYHSCPVCYAWHRWSGHRVH